MPDFVRSRAVILLTSVSLLGSFVLLGQSFAIAQQAPPSGGGVQASGPTFRAIRSISGSKGAVQGNRYVLEDPRTIFYLPQDKQVIVYFEWEGPTGLHKFEGYWKNPDAKVNAISDFSFEAKDKRFGAYWTLTLSDTMQTGLWTLEARVDGEVTGTHAFQILAAEKPAASPPPPRMLSAAELYKRAGDATVAIERLDVRGQRFGNGLGFFIGENLVATAFEAIDGATTLRIVLPGGQRVQCDTVLAWNRRQDWALLEAAASGAPRLERADLPVVGDHVFLLDLAGEGGRMIASADVVGVQDHPGAGQRLALSYSPSIGAVGGPVLDEYGKVAAIAAGSLYPGVSTLQASRLGASYGLSRLSGVIRGSLSVPIGLVSMGNAKRVSLADLVRSGQSTAPLTQDDDILSGVFCKQVDKKAFMGKAIGESVEFRSSDSDIFVYLSMEPKSKRKVETSVELYDMDNRALLRSKPSKIQFDTGKIIAFDWRLPIKDLAPGLYRVDVLFDGNAAWRGFFRVNE